jgi:hypothetical protein
MRLCHGPAISSTAGLPLLIEGDDGTRMDRRAIINALRVGMREEVGGQPT